MDSKYSLTPVFKFNLGDTVKIYTSGETGTVIGRAEHLDCTDTYMLRYKAAEGHATEQWWAEGALVKA